MCGSTYAFPPVPPTVVITEDLGGYVSDYNARFDQLRRANAHVIIAGECASACARFMKLPDICATPNATLWFHAMYDRTGTLVADSIVDSKLYETEKAFRLQDKYGVWHFGFVKARRQPKDIAKERGVAIAYSRTKTRGVFQKWLKVKATKLIPPC